MYELGDTALLCCSNFILFWLVPISYAYGQSLLPRSALALLENWALEDFVVIDADEI